MEVGDKVRILHPSSRGAIGEVSGRESSTVVRVTGKDYHGRYVTRAYHVSYLERLEDRQCT